MLIHNQRNWRNESLKNAGGYISLPTHLQETSCLTFSGADVSSVFVCLERLSQKVFLSWLNMVSLFRRRVAGLGEVNGAVFRGG